MVLEIFNQREQLCKEELRRKEINYAIEGMFQEMKQKSWKESKNSALCPIFVVMVYMSSLFQFLRQAKNLEQRLKQADEEQAKQ